MLRLLKLHGQRHLKTVKKIFLIPQQLELQDIKIKLPEKNSSYQLEKLKQLQQDQKIFNSNIIEIDLREIGRATIKVPGGEELQTGLDEV